MYFVLSHFECSSLSAHFQHSKDFVSTFFTAEGRLKAFAFSLVGLLRAAAVQGGVVDKGGAETKPRYSTGFSPRDAWKH